MHDGAAPHIPVLLDKVLDALAPRSGGRYIDCTVGAGGHAAALLKASSPDGRLLGLDGDPEALAIAREALRSFGERAALVRSNFNQLNSAATAYGFVPAQGVLLDLGLSSMQLSNPLRGFSFSGATLDMRMDSRNQVTAADLVNELPESELADLIYRYGEEHFSRRIARRIVEARPVESAQQLAEVIERTLGRRGRTHPATKTLQALRIVVNRELENLESVLPKQSSVTLQVRISDAGLFHGSRRQPPRPAVIRVREILIAGNGSLPFLASS